MMSLWLAGIPPTIGFTGKFLTLTPPSRPGTCRWS